MNSFNGIVYQPPDQELIHLLLEEVTVKVLICDGKALDDPLNGLAHCTDACPFLSDQYQPGWC
jgi:hypothetical protein